MLDAEWSVDEVADVTLVEVTVSNPTAVDRRVRVDDRLDGPTLPPRTDGVPERGWDADGYDGVVPAGERVHLGYASPSPPAEPPVSVEDEGRVGDDVDGRDADAAEAVRLLADASPPADALPSPEVVEEAEETEEPGDGPASDGAADVPRRAARNGDGTPEDGGGTESKDGTGGDGPAWDALRSFRSDGAEPESSGADGRDAGAAAGRGEGGVRDDEAAGDRDGGPDEELPARVADWLADVERRVEHAERLTDASVVEAAAVIEERGGLAAVEDLPERVADDEAVLRAVAERAATLADRAATTDVPVSALRRLS
ncbi:MAG: hypothetical protein ABEH47_05030 [Haloferacaceae archaeon]